MSYEQKYNEALETVQEILNSGLDAIRIKTLKFRLQSVFPELKESEDEIRKDIISFLKDFEKDHYRSVNFNSWIAWLEKQGDNKKLDADKVIEWLKNTIKERAENYGVYKVTRLILPYNSIEDLINDFKEDFGL